jgi:anion-transporting  ArsA/GET3 family ATPase
MARPAPRASLDDNDRLEFLVSTHDVIVVCGSGGVGKTTTAAALGAVAATETSAKVLVLTVDPARRLANALGLEAVGNRETRIEPAAFAAAGVEPRGELWAAMLDMKASWDDLVRRHAPDRATRDAILANPLYRNITSTFTQSHDYIATERLHDIQASGRYDLIVVDTPPSRNAIDFLEAPARMADFFSSRLLRWLITPYRSKLVNLASRPFYAVADRVLGAHFLADIAEFFILFQSMYDGFVARARAVERTLRDPRTTFLVVTTLEAAPAQEAVFFVEELAARRFDLGALVLNRVLPEYFESRAARRAARALAEDPTGVVEAVGEGPLDGVDPATLGRLLGEIGVSFEDYLTLATREADLRHRLSALCELTVGVPHLERDVADLAGLLAVGHRLWGSDIRPE